MTTTTTHRQVFEDMVTAVITAGAGAYPKERLRAADEAFVHAATLREWAEQLSGDSYRGIDYTIETAVYNMTFGNFESAYRNLRKVEEWCESLGMFSMA